ncbi:MAG: hypothetical protein MZU91_12345 [Desulfosudis oleivorans]|nr:hypothetical protein [Desulfosudis oleivorans]
MAAKDFGKARPIGGNNNEILVDDYDRLSGVHGAQRRLHRREDRQGLSPPTETQGNTS